MEINEKTEDIEAAEDIEAIEDIEAAEDIEDAEDIEAAEDIENIEGIEPLEFGEIVAELSKPVPENNIEPDALAQAVVRILDEKKAKGLKLLHVEKKTIIADYFVICSGTSNTAIRALANELEFKLGERGIYPAHIDGLNEATWVVLDYSSVIVHIFSDKARSFYNLEKLWNEAEEIDISDMLDKE